MSEKAKPISAGVKNIYQRMLEVQLAVQTVQKNETVKMSDNDKGYKAVTHDDVAAVLHVPLAKAGIVMLPDIESFETTSFDKTNQWGKIVTWYRTDIKILVKWINVDIPEDFITSKGAAFALDTSDKSFAKAYSLALKIVLLKVHLLESRDGEEDRPFDQSTGGATAGKGESKQQQQQKQTEKQMQSPQTPGDVIMPFGRAQGQKLGSLDLDTLNKAHDWLKSEIEKTPKPTNLKQMVFILSQVNAVLIEKAPKPDLGPKAEFDPVDEIQQPSSPENESQANGVGDYVMPFGDHTGKTLNQINEPDLKATILWIDAQLKAVPPVKGVSEYMTAHAAIKRFLISVDAWPVGQTKN